MGEGKTIEISKTVVHNLLLSTMIVKYFWSQDTFNASAPLCRIELVQMLHNFLDEGE